MRRFIGLAGVVVVVLVVASGCVLSGSWTALTPAAPPAPPPGVTADPDFSDVSCPTEDFCLAVGAVVGDDYSEWIPLAETWDGSSWSVVDTSDLERPDPPGETFTERLDHVSCRAVDDCVATVSELYDDGSAADIYGLVFTWDGTDWDQLELDLLEPEGAKDVDCSPGGDCIIWERDLGGYAIWDGTAVVSEDWTFADGPGSCAGQDFCVRNAQWAGFAEHWDGATWTTEPLPEEEFVASAIDCTSPARCVAVGIFDADFDEVGELTSALWNGTEWTMPDVPVTGEGTFDGVSCVGAECVALGTAAGARVTLAFSGNKWYEVEGTPGGADTVYEDLSCVGLSCLAVGWSGPAATSSLVAAEYDWSDQGPSGIVVNTALDGPDADPGDGVCEMTPGEGDCSLRAAIDVANADPAQDLITVADGIDPVLTVSGANENDNASGDLDVLTKVTIDGQGATVDGNGVDGVFHLYLDDYGLGRELTLRDITVTGGSTGGIETEGHLWLQDAAVTGNGGPGVHGYDFEMGTGRVMLDRVVVSDNGGHGLDLSDFYRVWVSGSTIESNGEAGIESAFTSDLRVVDSTVAENDTYGVLEYNGTGVKMVASTVRDNGFVGVDATSWGVDIRDSAIYGNGAGVSSGDFAIVPSTIVNTTITDNDGPAYAVQHTGVAVTFIDSTLSAPDYPELDPDERGTIWVEAGTVRLRGTIVVGDGVPACLRDEVIVSEGHNIASDDSCGLDQASDLEDTDPLLGPLADNGGPSWTRLPGPGSLAIDAVAIGTAGLCDGTVPTDQRGVLRPQGAACDIGAVEQ